MSPGWNMHMKCRTSSGRCYDQGNVLWPRTGLLLFRPSSTMCSCVLTTRGTIALTICTSSGKQRKISFDQCLIHFVFFVDVCAPGRICVHTGSFPNGVWVIWISNATLECSDHSWHKETDNLRGPLFVIGCNEIISPASPWYFTWESGKVKTNKYS